MVQGEICNLQKEVGPCKAFFPRFYFDKVVGECKEFIYGGCRGNANNFKTLDACQATCSTCQLPKQVGPCKGFFRRFYFDKVAGKCKKFIYGGCGGNANNFKTLDACQATCSTCQLPKQVGPCKGFFRRFYFDKVAGKCKKFTFGGCKGNANNFITRRACKAKCLK